MTKPFNFHLATGHHIVVEEVAAGPGHMTQVALLPYSNQYTSFWIVSAPGIGHIGWVGRGHAQAPRQHVVWYPNGKMWTSQGQTIEQAVTRALAEAWMYI